MLVACLLTFLLALTAAAPTTPEPPNGIRQCARSECPVYTQLEDLGPDIWKRRIEPGVWARRVSPTCNATVSVGLVYLDLHYYFTENNISRTTPIMLEIKQSKARPTFCPDQLDSFPCCEDIYALLFYIPAASQATAPEPSKESGVELVYMEDPREFYGINFDGRATVPNVTAKYAQLTEFLVDEDIAFEDDTYIVASYDAPWRPTPHRNEILIPIKRPRKNKPKCNQNDGQQDGGGEGDQNETGEGDQNENGEGDRNENRRRGGGGRRQRRSLSDIANIDLIPY